MILLSGSLPRSWPEWPITAEKFTGWLNGIDAREEVVNVFIDYETIGERLWKETGIFDFFKALPKVVFSKSNFTFDTPGEITKQASARSFDPCSVSDFLG